MIINVEEDPAGGSDGFWAAMQSTADFKHRFEGVTDADELMKAAKAAGAIDVRAVHEAVLLEGGTRRDLAIVGMHARVLRREPALAGALIWSQPAAEREAIMVGFDLDQDNAAGRDVSGYMTPRLGGTFFDGGKVVTLLKAEMQPLELIGISSSDYVEWVVEAQVVVDGKTETVTIGDPDKPFRVTGPLPADVPYQHYYEWRPGEGLLYEKPSIPLWGT